MYQRRRLGDCCSTGPVAGLAQLDVAEQGALAPMAAPTAELPWAKLFAVSVAAGLTIHFLTKPKR